MQTGQPLPGAGQDIIKEEVAHVNVTIPFRHLNGLDVTKTSRQNSQRPVRFEPVQHKLKLESLQVGRQLTREAIKIATAKKENTPGLLESRPRQPRPPAASHGPPPHTRSY